MILRSLLLSIFLFSSLTYSAFSDNAGRAPYAIQQASWPCKAFFKSMRGATHLRISFLWNTFGTSNKCLNKVLEDPRLETLQVILVNDVCTRHGRCGNYELLRGMTVRQVDQALAENKPAFMMRFKNYLSEASNYLLPKLKSNVNCLVTPLLESNVSGKAASVAIQTSKQYFPRCSVGWSEVGNTPPSGIQNSEYTEEHGAVKARFNPCVVNLDGEMEINEPKLKTFLDVNARCRAAFMWSAEDNCIASSSFVDPRKRVCSPGKDWNLFGRYMK